jgi:hypothetical protein
MSIIDLVETDSCSRARRLPRVRHARVVAKGDRRPNVRGPAANSRSQRAFRHLLSRALARLAPSRRFGDPSLEGEREQKRGGSAAHEESLRARRMSRRRSERSPPPLEVARRACEAWSGEDDPGRVERQISRRVDEVSPRGCRRWPAERRISCGAHEVSVRRSEISCRRHEVSLRRREIQRRPHEIREPAARSRSAAARFRRRAPKVREHLANIR